MIRRVKVIADPKRPYKTYAAIAGAAIGSLLTSTVVKDSPWAMAIGAAVLAGILTYIKGNPNVHIPEDD